MKPLIVYHFLDYIKSYRYVPPVTVYLITLVVNYTYQPNPVLSSYGVTALYLYLITAWITLSFFHTEDPVQQKLTILHAKSETKYFLSKYFTMLLFVLVLSVFSLMYPIVFGMFGEDLNISKVVIGFLSHLLLGALSISMSVLFTRNLVEKPSNAWLGVSLALVITIAAAGLKGMLPGVLKMVIWVLPPVSKIIGLMEKATVQEIFPEIGFVYIWLCIYSIVLAVLFLLMENRKGHEMF